MKPVSAAVTIVLLVCCAYSCAEKKATIFSRQGQSHQQVVSYQKIAGELLSHVKYGESYREELFALDHAERKDLIEELRSDNDKKAFWLNIYNAFVQIKLREDKDTYNNRSIFFKTKYIMVAGYALSLDDIENNLLRRPKQVLLKRVFSSTFNKSLGLQVADWRIHFAMNCGAKSCPLVLFYDPATIDEQLERATRSYLASEVQYNTVNNTIVLPKLFSWYSKDFGGHRGILRILGGYGFLKPGNQPHVQYSEFNWSQEQASFK